MGNPFQIAGAQPRKPGKRAPLYQGARFSSGLWTNRAAMRDAASSRLEEKFYGPRGDAFLGGQNLEITQRLTVGRRPGSSVWNNNTWSGVNSFYEFRVFNANTEQIKTVVDTTTALYDGSNNSQKTIWTKSASAGQSFLQSVGNVLFWGDGANEEKWINTLQQRIPYKRTNISQNPYNFTPFDLDVFIIDSNGNAQQLIGTVLQLGSFYILNNFVVFTLKQSNTLPTIQEILTRGLDIYFGPTSQFVRTVGVTTGVTLSINQIVGTISSFSLAKGGSGYAVNDVVTINQSSTGAQNGTFKVTAVKTSAGTGYTSATVPTTSNNNGIGCTLNLTTSSGALVSATIANGGTGYQIGDIITPVQISGSGGFFTASSVSGGVVTAVSLVSGIASTISQTNVGSGYLTSNSAGTTTTGSGIGLTINITSDNSQFNCFYVYSGGPVSSATLSNAGNNYLIGDVLTPIEATNSASTGCQFSVSGILGSVSSVTMNSGGSVAVPYVVGGCSFTQSSNLGVGATFTISTVSGGLVTSVSLGTGGTGYSVGDLFYVTQGSATGCVVVVTSVGGGGVIVTLNVAVGGQSGYTTGTGVPTNTSGAGTGCTININSVNGSGQILTFSVNAPGSGYSVGDLLYPVQGSASTAVFTVAGLTGTIPTAVVINTPSSGNIYPSQQWLNTTGGAGTGLQVMLLANFLPPRGFSGYSISGIRNGNGYGVGDIVTVSGGDGSLTLKVTAVSSASGPIKSLSLIAGGTGYITASNIPLSGGHGSGATANLVVSNNQFFPSTTSTDNPTVFIGGNPISDGTANTAVVWAAQGQTTVDGSALWYNRGTTVDGGLVYNWGLDGSSDSPSAVVNGSIGGWTSNTYYSAWDIIIVTVLTKNYVMQVTSSGKSGVAAPAWIVVPGQITTDGTVTWTCLSNDLDTSLTWASDTVYSIGHILEQTVSSVSCVFQLQPFTGITTQGSNFPVYIWQCNSQSGSDVGAAAEIPSGSTNAAMARDGGQSLNSATFTSTMSSLFLTTGGSSPIASPPIAGDGTVSPTPTTLCSATQNISVVMLPNLVIPQAGIYTFQIGHQNAMFWGIGNGSITLNVTKVTQQSGTLTLQFDRNIGQTLTNGVSLTLSGLTNATWLNGQTITVQTVNNNTITASLAHSNYGPASDKGIASSGATLQPSLVSGPVTWPASTSPNTYDYSSGTPINGYPVMSANYPSQGTSMVVDNVQINFPSAGVYPAEILYGFWYHSIQGYSTPVVSPVLPVTTYAFYMIYQQPNGSTFYNIIPQGIASSSATAPTWPSFPASISGMQSIAPNYPAITEASGNYTWWNLGPSSNFGWTASTNYTLSTFVIDQLSNKQIPYEPGISGSAEPTFSTTLNGLVTDSGSLIWMNDGAAGTSAAGTLTTSHGGWSYCISLVNSIDDTVSNASPISSSTGSFFGATGIYVSGGLPSVIDPQADYVAIFRTQDGGATYFLIPSPSSGNGNSIYTLPLATYQSQGFTDTNTDSSLNTLLEAPILAQNSPPKTGFINCCYRDNRIFGSVGNTVFWSTGPDTPVGNGFNSFSADNFAEYPSKVIRLVPLNIGILVFTLSDIYLLSGDGTANSPFTSQPFLQKIGLLSYNALTINGSIIYFMTTDNQVVELNVHSGVSGVGFPIADLLDDFDASKTYLTWHVHGSNDQCLFVADGSTGWYRMCPTPAPESGTLTWSLKANIQGGVGAIQSVETEPGNIQLLMGPPPGFSGPLLARDYSQYTDNGKTYICEFILGSLVVSYPGQVASLEFITTDSIKVPGSVPISLGVRIGEIAGAFTPLTRWVNDPPQLLKSQTLYSQRFYLIQADQASLCRHLQIYGKFEATDSPDELLTITVFGGYSAEG